MRIAFFIGSMGRGGAERVISLLANRYFRQGWDVDLVLLLGSEVSYDLEQEIRIVDLSPCGGSYLKNAVGWLKKVRAYIRQNHPDRIVSFVARINALVLTAALRLHADIIVSERNDPRQDGRGAVMQRYCNAIYRTARAVVFQTKYERGCFSPALAPISHIIPNPVSVSAQRKRPAAGIRIVTAGRLAPQKNQLMLVEAVRLLKDEGFAVSCDIYGDGPMRDALADAIRQRDLEDTVHLPGSVRDIHEKICDATAFVLTSDFEGLSNALIEAMMLGLPCITTNYSGAEELITDGVNGLIVGRDDAHGLVVAVKRLLAEKELVQRLKTAALASSRQYEADFVLQKWEKVIDLKEETSVNDF